METYDRRKVVIFAILAFAVGIVFGAALTLGLEIAKVRQVVLAQIEGNPAARGAPRMAEGVTRLVARELSLTAAQEKGLERSLASRLPDIQALRLAVSQSVREIAQEVYAEIRPELSDDQRAKAERILH